MPELDTIILVTLAGLALSASPGPSMLYVLSRSVGQSISAGLASTAGLALGGVVLAIASALGIAAIVQQSTIAYMLMRGFGALYLIYLGVQVIRNIHKEKMEVSKIRQESFSKIFGQGVIVELLNPKTILFFVAFLPQFVNPESGNLTLQFLILGMLVPLTAIPSDIVVALAGGSLANKLSEKPTISAVLNWISGLILIGLGLRIVFFF